MAHEVTRVTHDHPEGLAGAEIVAALVFLARCGIGKEKLREYAESHYRPLDFTLDAIRPGYAFDESCQGTVPQAIVAFLESRSFTDAVRNAISIGGDSDTLGAITGAIAEAYYGVPVKIREQALSYLDDGQKAALLACEKGLFNLHVTGSGWESLDAEGNMIAWVDSDLALEMGLVPTLEQLMAEEEE